MNGKCKALIKIDGQTILYRIYQALSPLVNETIIVSNHPDTDYGIPASIHEDIIKHSGPLGGIHSALSHATHSAVLIVASDMPFITPTLANLLINAFIQNEAQKTITVPQIDGRTEPLFGIYSKSLVPAISNILSHNGKKSVQQLLETSNTNWVTIDPTPENIKTFTNINTPADMKIFGD